MRQLQRSAVTFGAAFALTALAGAAQARPGSGDAQPAGQAEPQGNPQGVQGKQAPQGETPSSNEATASAYGDARKGIGERGTLFVLGPLEPKGMGAGIGGGCGQETGTETQGSIETGRATAAPVPQYWLADASLFAANARNAAQALASEQIVLVHAPGVLSNQAQFMIAATDRAISSLASLQAHAESARPAAVSGIVDAMNQLTAARAQETLALEATDQGTLGPGQESTVRSAYEHLQAAERSMTGVGRAYGAHGFTQTTSYGLGRGFGAGIGAVPGAQKAPEGTPKTPEATPKTPEPSTPAPAPVPTPAPETP